MARVSSDQDADQYFELEVTPPGDASVYSYMRLGTWGDDPNSGAAKMRDLQQAAKGATETGNPEGLIRALTAISGADAADEAADLRAELSSSAATRNQKRNARTTALNAYQAVRRPYDAAATAAAAAHADMVQWREAYESTPESETQRRRDILREYHAKKGTYERVKETLDGLTAQLEPVQEALEAADAEYQRAKSALFQKIGAALAQGQSTLVGAAEQNPVDRKRGHDLAMRVIDFYDDTRNRGTFEHLSVEERHAETAKLHTKGGWRDHTEGNRISTTRGDKIEVIRGNYRRMVLGRQDDSDEACLLDASGGLYMDGDFAPGSVVLVEYSTKYGDTWKCVEECSKGDVINKYHGDVEDHFYGDYVKSFVGKPGGADWDDADAIKPDVTEKTWAKTILSETHADDITETTRVSGTMKSNTTVGAGVVDMMAVGAGLVEMVTVGASHVSMEASTSQIELNLAPGHVSVDLALGMVDLFVGGKIDIVVAKHLAIDVGPRFELNASTKFKMEPIEDAITPLTQKISSLETKVGQAETDIKANRTAIAASDKTIAASAKTIAAVEKKIAGSVIIL